MQTQTASSDRPTKGDQRLVLRNTAYLGLAEVLTTPLSVLLNAMLGRYLGPANLGYAYFASTICGVAVLLVNWGHSGPLPAAVALDRASAGKLLGTSIAWRVGASIVAYAIIAAACYALGFSSMERWAVSLVFAAHATGTVLSACQDAIRGFERTDVAAYTRVGSQLLSTALVIPVLMVGGGLRITLAVQALGAVIVLAAVLRALPSIGIAQLKWSRALFGKLMREGTPFVFFGLVLALQPSIDAFYLKRLTPSDVVGWFAVSQRLVGFLLIPATALIGALYPTLCRLHVTDRPGFLRTTQESLGTVSLVVVPVALGCACFPDIGVGIFGRDAFRPAEDTLRLFSLDLFLVYFSMPIGTALLAAGRQRIWTVVQLLCVVNSAILDPILITFFQARTGNGGTGLPVAATISETLIVGAGIALMERGVFNRALLRSLLLALVSGAAMAGTAWLLRGLPSLLVAPIAVAAYAAALYWTGALSRAQLSALQEFLRRKLRKAAGA